jgi:hypothetical protein
VDTKPNAQPKPEPVEKDALKVEDLNEITLDPVAIVNVGDTDGWAQYVLRLLDLGEGEYNADAAALVAELQEANGLEPDGVVSGATWALILPEGPVAELDAHAKAALWSLGGTDLERVDTDAWGVLIDAKLDELDI